MDHVWGNSDFRTLASTSRTSPPKNHGSTRPGKKDKRGREKEGRVGEGVGASKGVGVREQWEERVKQERRERD